MHCRSRIRNGWSASPRSRLPPQFPRLLCHRRRPCLRSSRSPAPSPDSSRTARRAASRSIPHRHPPFSSRHPPAPAPQTPGGSAGPGIHRSPPRRRTRTDRSASLRRMPARPRTRTNSIARTSFYTRKMYDYAIMEYEKFLITYPQAKGRDMALFRLAECHRMLNNEAAARSSYEKLLMEFREGEFAGAGAYRLGEYLFAERKYDLALGMFQTAAKYAASDEVKLTAKFNAARCLDKMGRPAEAIPLYREVASVEKNNSYHDFALLAVADALASEGKKAEAFAELEKLSSGDRQSPHPCRGNREGRRSSLRTRQTKRRHTPLQARAGTRRYWRLEIDRPHRPAPRELRQRRLPGSREHAKGIPHGSPRRRLSRGPSPHRQRTAHAGQPSASPRRLRRPDAAVPELESRKGRAVLTPSPASTSSTTRTFSRKWTGSSCPPPTRSCETRPHSSRPSPSSRSRITSTPGKSTRA